jgi:hypothetical protein
MPTIVFIHGLWLHSTSWTPWQEHFAQAGYASDRGRPLTIDGGWREVADTGLTWLKDKGL